MTIEVFNKRGCASAPYVSPDVKIVEIKVQSLICQSGDIDSLNKLNDDTSNWK